jgi:ABC-type nickel/cobalt efflux system permease component RcnA
MRRLAILVVAAVAAVVAALAGAGSAAAHPLGNFTVNHYAGVELSGRTTYVHVVLDLAEIPTFQVGKQVRASGYPLELARQLELRLDGRRVPLRVVERRVTERPGAGGLKTLRLDVVYEATGSGTRIAYADRSFGNRIGWREITVAARDGARVERSSVPALSESDALRAYPSELLRSPLDVRSAEATVTPGTALGTPPAIDPTAAPKHEGGGFEALIESGDLSLGVILVSLAIAAFWGAAHALTPGHGKALVAGYLIGTRGRPRDAVLLGATVTVTHTAGVFALGLVTLALSQFIVPEQLYPWLTLVSGLLVVAVGAAVLRMRLHTGGWHGHGHGHEHGHDHVHEHGHGARLQADATGHGHHHHHLHHDHDEAITRKGILGVGVAAGLLPCPSALVVLLSAIALHRVGFGLALIVAFSLGLAATITGIGLVAVMARRAFSRVSFEGRLVRALPAVSALVILGVGVVLTARAIPDVL